MEHKKQQTPKIIFFEANIGAGKTTLLERLKKYKNVQVILEPVDVWKNTVDSSGKNILDHFYTDTKKYSYLFQSFAFLSREHRLRDIDMDAKYIFVERSIYSDKNIFALNCRKNKMMEDIEWVIYNRWFKWANRTIGKYDYGFVYLECPPKKCYQRLKERNRSEESGVSLDYLLQLNDRHEEWLSNEKKPVLRLSSLDNYRDSDKVLDTFFTKIVNFTKNI